MTNNTHERTTAPGINAKPSEWFAHGLADWTTTRAQELTDPKAPSYAYYLDSFEDHMKALMRDYAGAYDATLAELNGGETWESFKATKTHLAAILGGIARQLGWRIVPVAKMAAAKSKDGELLARVEDECRQWVNLADAIRDGIRAAPGTKDELGHARFLVRGQFKTACEMVARLRADLGKTKI